MSAVFLAQVALELLEMVVYLYESMPKYHLYGGQARRAWCEGG